MYFLFKKEIDNIGEFIIRGKKKFGLVNFDGG